MTVVRDPDTQQGQKVNPEGQATTASTIQTELEHESEENSLGFNWSSDLVDVAANGTVLLVKNTSDTALHIEYVEVGNGAIASEYTLHMPTTEVTVTTVNVTGTNINNGAGKANVAEAEAASNETNNSQGNVIATRFMAIDSDRIIPTPGVILGKNKSIALDVVENTAESSCTIVGHYAD